MGHGWPLFWEIGGIGCRPEVGRRVTRHRANHNARSTCALRAGALSRHERMPMDRSCDRCGRVSEIPVELDLPSLRDRASILREHPGYPAPERGPGRARQRLRWLGPRPEQGTEPLDEPRHRQAQRARAKRKKSGDDDRAAKHATEPAHLSGAALLSTTPRTRAQGLINSQFDFFEDRRRLSAVLP